MRHENDYDAHDFGGAADTGCYVDAFDDRDGPYGPGNDPVMHDCKPYGWGVDRHEDPALQLANETVLRESDNNGSFLYVGAGVMRSPAYGGRYYPVSAPLNRDRRNFLWSFWSQHDAAMEKKSDRAWDCICDHAKTHTEACERYAAWANRWTGKNLNMHGKRD